MLGGVTPPHVTSPTWGPRPSCKQALNPVTTTETMVKWPSI